MRKPCVPRDLLGPVIDYFKPQRVILFGSRARGTAAPESDVDLLVVVDDDTPSVRLTMHAGYEARRCYRGAADVVPCRAVTLSHKEPHRGDPSIRGGARRYCRL